MDPRKDEELKRAIIAIRDANQAQELLDDQSVETQQLQSAIRQICSTFLMAWKQEYLPQIQSFRNACRDGIPVPALTVCGHGTREIRWTKYLSFFLNPTANHGLDNKLLVAAFGDQLRNQQIDLDRQSEILVEDEVFIGSVNRNDKKDACICDIVVRADEWVLFIEQKIKSSESNNASTGLTQLIRYSEAIRSNPAYNDKKIVKIFLTPTGRIPHGVTDWLPMAHQELIHTGRKILKDDSLSSIARGNLSRFLLDMAVGPYDQTDELLTEMKELAEVLCQNGFLLQSFIRYSYLNQFNSNITELIREGI